MCEKPRWASLLLVTEMGYARTQGVAKVGFSFAHHQGGLCEDPHWVMGPLWDLQGTYVGLQWGCYEDPTSLTCHFSSFTYHWGGLWEELRWASPLLITITGPYQRCYEARKSPTYPTSFSTYCQGRLWEESWQAIDSVELLHYWGRLWEEPSFYTSSRRVVGRVKLGSSFRSSLRPTMGGVEVRSLNCPCCMPI